MRGGDVIQALKRVPEVVSCDVMSGEFDLVVRVEASVTDRIREIWQDVSALPGVRDTLTAFALSSVIKR
jgi:Lrp/AsnC family leucine-responsive transcriptional regulator